MTFTPTRSLPPPGAADTSCGVVEGHEPLIGGGYALSESTLKSRLAGIKPGPQDFSFDSQSNTTMFRVALSRLIQEPSSSSFVIGA